MSKVSPPTSSVHSSNGSRIDASRNRVGGAAGPVSPNLIRPASGSVRHRETCPDEPLGETFHWPVEWMPLAGRADMSQRGANPFGNHRCRGAGGIDGDKSGSRIEPQASADVVAADQRTHVALRASAENSESVRSPASLSDGWLTSIGHGLLGLWKRLQQRRQISRSIAELSLLDDRTLRDIGIPHRLQISERVRSARKY